MAIFCLRLAMDIREIKTQVDVKKFIKSWEFVFQRRLDESVYTWAFSGNNHIYGCFDEGSVVAGYCLLDIAALINKKKYQGGLCNNVFVNGFKYQKKGVFGQITEFALNDIANNGYDFALGFPNKKAIKAHVRSGWQQETDLPFYEFELNSNFLINFSQYRFEWCDVSSKKVFQDISRFMSERCERYSFSLLKDTDFLTWRFENNPRWHYDICCIYCDDALEGFFVSKYYVEKKRVHLVDYFFDTGELAEASLSSIYNKYKVELGQDVDYVDAWCAEGDHHVFEQAGFLRSSEFSYVIFKDLANNNLRIGNSPHFTLSDNDVF